MLLGLGKEIKDADVVHVHSNWTFPVWWGAWLALRHKKTLVMSPHGSYNPLQLKHSVWKKNLVGWLDQWVLRRASVIHVTCEAEKRWALAFLQGRSEKLKVQRVRTKIVVIPNGVC
jgi:glycosyltransferase involved in cell wall biosynthesis